MASTTEQMPVPDVASEEAATDSGSTANHVKVDGTQVQQAGPMEHTNNAADPRMQQQVLRQSKKELKVSLLQEPIKQQTQLPEEDIESMLHTLTKAFTVINTDVNSASLLGPIPTEKLVILLEGASAIAKLVQAPMLTSAAKKNTLMQLVCRHALHQAEYLQSLAAKCSDESTGCRLNAKHLAQFVGSLGGHYILLVGAIIDASKQGSFSRLLSRRKTHATLKNINTALVEIGEAIGDVPGQGTRAAAAAETVEMPEVETAIGTEVEVVAESATETTTDAAVEQARKSFDLIDLLDLSDDGSTSSPPPAAVCFDNIPPKPTASSNPFAAHPQATPANNNPFATNHQQVVIPAPTPVIITANPFLPVSESPVINSTGCDRSSNPFQNTYDYDASRSSASSVRSSNPFASSSDSRQSVRSSASSVSSNPFGVRTAYGSTPDLRSSNPFASPEFQNSMYKQIPLVSQSMPSIQYAGRDPQADKPARQHTYAAPQHA